MRWTVGTLGRDWIPPSQFSIPTHGFTVADVEIVFLAKHKIVLLTKHKLKRNSLVRRLVVYKKELETAVRPFHAHDYLWCVSEFMTVFCACGCLLNVETTGHFRKDCRRRITAAGGVCPPNVRSAAAKRNDATKNLKNNLKNNLKSNKKKKLPLRAANLRAVQDDPTIHQTLKMSTGTSASVSVLTDGDSHDSFAESLVYSLAHAHSLESPDSLAYLID